ncbi:hypothetical protein AND_008023 [Anopheles darlingi]|uniref:Alpha-1,6-mannosyl-glycoprotein 2-beta-N-acetylglucosaminyltransferase n=1 Tax=Anopheles darlingi TaxID=43151 RepID=W5JBV7_ANODA|nr:hypothetical protein AND_008023 [Anopheles darlingi]
MLERWRVRLEFVGGCATVTADWNGQLRLAQARDISRTLLVFSHDYYDDDINDLVQSIDFCKVMQIFYPFSIQTHPNEFPGSDPDDCPRDIKKEQALLRKCNNALHPDLYGHYREAKFTQTKHHWWWKANRVFDQLEVTKYHTGMVVFLEEDHYVAEDFLHILELMFRKSQELCPKCNILSLGTYLKTFNYYTYNKKTLTLLYLMYELISSSCSSTNTTIIRRLHHHHHHHRHLHPHRDLALICYRNRLNVPKQYYAHGVYGGVRGKMRPAKDAPGRRAYSSFGASYGALSSEASARRHYRTSRAAPSIDVSTLLDQRLDSSTVFRITSNGDRDQRSDHEHDPAATWSEGSRGISVGFDRDTFTGTLTDPYDYLVHHHGRRPLQHQQQQKLLQQQRQLQQQQQQRQLQQQQKLQQQLFQKQQRQQQQQQQQQQQHQHHQQHKLEDQASQQTQVTTEKSASQSQWGYQVLPTLYSIYQKVEVTPWVSSKHNMGMAFNRTTWYEVVRCARHFCEYDDYNWDWSLQHVSQQCLKEKLHVMVVKGPRVFHIGECGVHHKKSNCESNEVISKVQQVLKVARSSQQLFPRSISLTQTSVIKKTNLRKGNGGWGDQRDHLLCLNITFVGR